MTTTEITARDLNVFTRNGVERLRHELTGGNVRWFYDEPTGLSAAVGGRAGGRLDL